MTRWFQPRTPVDWVVLGFVVGTAAYWSHVLRADIPVITIIGG
jgi:hypothetical protein